MKMLESWSKATTFKIVVNNMTQCDSILCFMNTQSKSGPKGVEAEKMSPIGKSSSRTH